MSNAMPSDLSAMLEAVEKYMGEQFTDMLDDAITRATDRAYSFGYRVRSSTG